MRTNKLWNANLKIAAGFVLGVTLSLALLPLLVDVRAAEFREFASAYSAVLLVPLTAIYSVLTWYIVQETRRTRDDAIRPHVVVTLEPGKYVNFFDLVIENIGRGAAYSVSISFDPDIKIIDEGRSYMLSTVPFLRPPILKSNQIHRGFIGQYRDFYPNATRATIQFSDVSGRLHTLSNDINLEIFNGMNKLVDDDLHKISENVEIIARALKRFTSLKHINVQVSSSDDKKSD